MGSAAGHRAQDLVRPAPLVVLLVPRWVTKPHPTQSAHLCLGILGHLDAKIAPPPPPPSRPKSDVIVLGFRVY